MLECFERATVEFFRHLIRPERFDDWRKLFQASSHLAARRSIRGFQAARVVQEDVACFAAGSVGTGIGKLNQRRANGSDRNTPDFRSAENRRFFARWKFDPEPF